MAKTEEAHRYAIIGMLAEEGKLDKVKEVQAKIVEVVNAANTEEEGLGDTALGLVAFDIAIAQDS